MADKETTPCYTISLVLAPSEKDEVFLDSLINDSNQIFNAVEDEGEKRIHKLRNLGERLTLIIRMKDLKKQKNLYRKTMRNEKLADAEQDQAARDYLNVATEIAFVKVRLAEIKTENGFNCYALQKFAHIIAKNIETSLPYDIVSNISDDAWRALNKHFKGESKKLRRRATRGTGMLWSKHPDTPFAMVGDSAVRIAKRKIAIAPDQKRDGDEWISQALAAPTRRVGIQREIVGNKKIFRVLLQKEGVPPRLNDGNCVMSRDSRVILDPGPSAVFEMWRNSDEMTFCCYELCRNVELREEERNYIKEQMSRSLCQSNPQCFDENGTLIKGSRFTNKSKRYIKLKNKLAIIENQVALERNRSHERLANIILSHGNHIIVDRTRWAALAKRSKESKPRKDNGRLQSTKRFGTSISRRAPGLLLAKVEERVGYCDGCYEEIDPLLAKTSQYDHILNVWTKVGLEVRWKKIGGKYWVQRDCYTLFYIDHLIPLYEIDKSGQCKLVGYQVDRQGMIDEFDDFLTAQERFMEWVDAHGSDKIKELAKRPQEMYDELNLK